MVHSYAQRCAMALANVEQAVETFFKPFQLRAVFVVGIFYVAELARRVYIIPGINAHGFNGLGCLVGHIGIEMHVGHKGCPYALCTQPVTYAAKALHLAQTLGGKAHVIGPGTYYAPGLCNASFHIVGRSSVHALQPYGMIAAQRCAPHVNVGRGAPAVVE